MREPLCGFFRAYSKGDHVGIANMEAVAALSRKGVPHEWESASFGYKYLDAVDDLQLPSDPMKIGQVKVKAWEGVQRDMLKIGAIDKAFDVNSFTSNEFIGCANDFNRAEVDAEAAAWLADPANAKWAKKPDLK